MFAKPKPGIWPARRLVWLASVSIGTATGLLAGQSGPDAHVLAAVLPVVISGAGGALVVLPLKRRQSSDYVLTAISVILFTISLTIGAQVGRSMRADDETATYLERLKIKERIHKSQYEYQVEFLERCSKDELIINEGRKALGLGPVPDGLLCSSNAAPAFDMGRSVREFDERKTYDESFTFKNDTYRRQVEFLERCSKDEFIINEGRKAHGLDPVPAGLLCDSNTAPASD